MKRIILTSLFILITVTLFGASPEMEFNQQLYNVAATTAEKHKVLQDVVNSNLSDAEDFYAWVLECLVTDYPNVRGNQNIDAANEMMKILAGLLGEAKHLPSAGYLWRAENTFTDPIVKADILVALGKMKAVDFLPQVVQILQDLNQGRVSRNSQDRERLAYGAVIALENYADPSGYLPVFLASTAWYSETIKNQARLSFPKIIADPTEPLTELIKSPSYDYNTKYLALQTIENASVSNDVKSEFAVTAYAEIWRTSISYRGRQMDLARIRKLCISMINRYKTENTAVYPLLERSYKEGIDTEEKIEAVVALASLASEDSVRLLSSFLAAINEKLRDGTLRQADERMMRELISALGRTGRSEAAPALRSVQTVDWTNAVKRLAADALKNVQ